MIVGEQSFISPEVRDQFMTTGTVHILSISGSHLGLLGFLSFWVVQGITRRLPSSWVERLSCRMTANQFAVLATIPLVLFYTVVSGAHVATVRSLLMVFLYLLAVWLGHARQVLIALGLSAVLVTFHDPTVLQEISFQLSYGAVLVIALALRWWERNHAEDPRHSTSRFHPPWGQNADVCGGIYRCHGGHDAFGGVLFQSDRLAGNFL